MKIKQPLKNAIAKVPVIMQLEALECGAASLAMVFAYYDLWIPLEQLRKECGVSRDGSNMASIYQVAAKYGFKPRAFRANIDRLKEIGTFPAIIFWEYNHFVVLDGFKGDIVYLNDPARGRVRMPVEEFNRSYSQICMLLEPTENFKPEGEPASIMEFVKERLKGSLPMFLLLTITTLIASLTGMLLPAFSRFFVDNLLIRGMSQWSGGFFILLGLTIFSQISSLVIKAVFMLKLQGKMAAVANTSFLWHILRLPVEFYEQRMAGDIAQRQQSNQDITNTLINTFTPLVLDFLTMIFNLCLMLNYSVFMGLIGLASVGVNLLLAQIISDKRIDITRVQTRDNANVMSTTLQGINMIETIKSAGAENGFFTKWAGYQANANIQTAKFAMLNQTFGQIPPLLSQLTSSLILFFAVRLIMRGEWTIGLVSAFTGYLTAFSTPATALIQAGQKIQEMRTNMERVQDVFKYPVDVDYDKTPYTSDEDLNKLEGLIEMKNVTFGYNRLNPPLLKDFSMRVEPGRSVAIVGPSGCGKSTIAKLVTGLYPIWDGEILFDGRSLSAKKRNPSLFFACGTQN